MRDGRIHIVPERFTKVYYNWLENIQDWCISRQLWWGHRIPVWYCEDCGKMIVARAGPDRVPRLPQHASCNRTRMCWIPGSPPACGLFPPWAGRKKRPIYKYFYPTSVLETGYDILFFWVARMIMDGLEFTGKPPFHTVYLHGLIRDEHGQKMSKTKGNVIDPLMVMDELGTDALRFTLLVGSTPGNDMNLSIKKVEANRNFANKIWNAGRFVIGALEQAPGRSRRADPDWTLADSWIWARLQAPGARRGAPVQRLSIWRSRTADLRLLLERVCRLVRGDRQAAVGRRRRPGLLHRPNPGASAGYLPAPAASLYTFVTEELWGHLKARLPRHTPRAIHAAGGLGRSLDRGPLAGSRSCRKAGKSKRWPIFSLVHGIVRAIRNLRSEKKVTPGKRIPAILAAGDRQALLQAEKKVICSLAYLDPGALRIVASLDEKPQGAASQVVLGIEVYLLLADLIDVEAERARITQGPG